MKYEDNKIALWELDKRLKNEETGWYLHLVCKTSESRVLTQHNREERNRNSSDKKRFHDIVFQ
jgi:hypothetical protein